MSSSVASGSGSGRGSGEGGSGRAPQKKWRENSKSQALEKEASKLEVEFAEYTGRTIGKNGVLFNNLIPQVIRRTVLDCTISWDDVDEHMKTLIIDRLDQKFIFPRTKVVIAEIERLCMSSLRDRRYKMRKFWKEHGGLENKDAPKRHLYYEEMNQADWDILCDHFGSEEQLQISEKNSINRSKRPLEGAHGSKTLVQHYHDAANPVTGNLPSAIDMFQQLYRKGDRWKNDFAESKFAEMVELRASLPEEETDGDADSQGGSTESAASTARSRLQHEG